jgi:pSer/pThr/pTyr-binding forkhead associated (FHA) protein
MIQLRVLSGKMAGENIFVRRFPFRVGRAAGNELVLDDDGVWDNHLTVGFEKSEGFTLKTAGDAFAAVNAEQKNSARLRNGDVISFGSAKIQFWLAAPEMRSLRPGELSVWLLLAGVTAFQIFLVCRLLK